MLNTLTPRDVVRCRSCGYRIFYKVRTERRESPGPEFAAPVR